MMSFFDEIKEKINKKINPENIILIDNSTYHSKHKSFDPNKLHLKIIIIKDMLKLKNRLFVLSLYTKESSHIFSLKYFGI